MSIIEILNQNPISAERAREMSPQVLAFVGDAVHTLFVRTNLSKASDDKVEFLQRKTSQQVKAKAQSDLSAKLMEIYTEEELYFFKRGRNASTGCSAKNATMIEYRRATGFETVIGYLYLTNQLERLSELLKHLLIV